MPSSTSAPDDTLAAAAEPPFDLDRRFDRFARLVGEAGMRRLAGAEVMIVGLGGVGSWTAESLVRSGVGAVTLVDFDDVCITNFNRQVHAVEGQVGRPKAEVMGERLRAINPAARVRVVSACYNAASSARILDPRPAFVIDAIDAVTAKCHLLATCRAAGIPLVSSTGSGGRLDPTQVAVADLGLTDVDPLARALRKLLRREYGFAAEGPFGIPAVFSREMPQAPHAVACDGGKGFHGPCAEGQNESLDGDPRRSILGTASFVTGVFGMHCAAVAVRALLGPPQAREGALS